jgi:hypothetical protein
MRGLRARSHRVPSRRRVPQLRRPVTGDADRRGRGRPVGDPSAPAIRAATVMRVGYAVLIAIAVAVLLFHEFTTDFAIGYGAHGTHATMVADPQLGAGHFIWALPAIAIAAAVGAGLVVASGTHSGHWMIARLGLPWLAHDARPHANGLAWAAVGVLGVHFTDEAFAAFPGGHAAAALTIGAALGYGTMRLHRHAIEHEAYRTFNLVAMLLAAGSLASMSITPTGEWWVHNFSTLGTSGDFAAMCFNVAVAASGGGIAGLSAMLTRGIAFGGFGIRRGARAVIRTLIGLVGFGLMGVGWVPISQAPDLHNAFALGAAGAFALLCIGAPWYAVRMPRSFIWFSAITLLLEVAAMAGYDGLHLFNLTVFEIVAFTLVFAWLIVFVAVTSVHRHEHGEADVATLRRGIHLARSRRSWAAHPHPESSADPSVVVGRGASCTGSPSPSRRNDGQRLRPATRRRHRGNRACSNRCRRDRADRRATPLRPDRRRSSSRYIAVPPRARNDRVHAHHHSPRVRGEGAR